jgi:hypothetical protein
MARGFPRWLVSLSLIVLVVAAGYYSFRAISQTRKYARDSGAHRDFDHFYEAAVAASRGEDPYESFRKGYIYPPLLAGMMQPLAGLERNPAYLVWFAINATIIAAAFVIAARELLRRFGVEARAPAVLVVVAGGLLPAFDQLRWQLEQGQTDGLLLLAFACGLRWMDRRPLLAGVLMGLAANIKYLSLIVLPFAVVRRRGRLGAGAVLGTALGLVLPALVFGWSRNAEFVRTSVGRLVHVVDAGPDLANTEGVNIHSLTWELNISLPAFAAKQVERFDLPSLGVPVIAVSLAAVLVVVAWRMFAGRGFRFWAGEQRGSEAKGRLGALEWIGLVVAAMAMSPQITVRHMVLMTLVYQCAIVLAIIGRGPSRWLPLVGVGVALLGMTMPPGGGDTWSSEVVLPVWRSVSGAMWCALACYAAVLWAGLGAARDAAGDQNSASSPSSDAASSTPM